MQSVVALGNFDGVHIGHAAVIARAVAVAKMQNCTPVLYTFSTHPQHFFGDGSLQLLTDNTEKEEQIRNLGIDTQIYDDFSRVADLSAEEFIKTVLVEQLHAAAVVTGPDYFFGKGKRGTAEVLQTLGKVHGFSVHTVPFTLFAEEKVSSTRLRTLLEAGDAALAALLLGRPYSIRGKVVSGKGLARKWGTPTVNITLPVQKVCPRYGVYAVELVMGEGVWQGVCNVGVRPSFDDGETPNMEVHVLNGAPPAANKAEIRFLQFLRAERLFTPDALAAQIKKDCADATKYFEERSRVE